MNRYSRYQPPCPQPRCEMRPQLDVGTSNPCEGGVIMPLAVPFVQWQRWGNVYDPETSLRHGTIFPDLDLPFCGSWVRQG